MDTKPTNTAGHDEEILTDFITSRQVPNAGAEANRQQVEKLLVEEKGFLKKEIEVDVPIQFHVEGQKYHSRLDLVVRVHGRRYMVIKCAAGSLASREREVLAAARLLDEYQIPLAIASDGQTALVWDTISGKKIGSGLEAIPNKVQAQSAFDPLRLLPLAEMRRSRQQLIFRSYDSMNVHRSVRSLG
ncbi:MAG: type I restriction enzyme HsdR N-terminal domain-containing protein [Desulfobacteraceae bacterium]|nr:type I restriction enzyme HsdR N-terminal domain-containing protein [Desulfobacteraceae bacterium]